MGGGYFNLRKFFFVCYPLPYIPVILQVVAHYIWSLIPRKWNHWILAHAILYYYLPGRRGDKFPWPLCYPWASRYCHPWQIIEQTANFRANCTTNIMNAHTKKPKNTFTSSQTSQVQLQMWNLSHLRLWIRIYLWKIKASLKLLFKYCVKKPHTKPSWKIFLRSPSSPLTT